MGKDSNQEKGKHISPKLKDEAVRSELLATARGRGISCSDVG